MIYFGGWISNLRLPRSKFFAFVCEKGLNPSVPGIPKTGRFHFQLKIIRVTDEIIISKLQQIHGALEFFAFGWLKVLKSETLGPDWLKRSHRFLKNFNKFVFECNFQAPQILQRVQISLKKFSGQNSIRHIFHNFWNLKPSLLIGRNLTADFSKNFQFSPFFVGNKMI